MAQKSSPYRILLQQKGEEAPDEPALHDDEGRVDHAVDGRRVNPLHPRRAGGGRDDGPKKQFPSSNGERRAFRHLGNGPLNPATDDLGTLGGNRSQAHAINAAGKVTGTARVAGNAASPAFLWEEGVGMTNLGALGSGTLAYGFAINSNDVVVGWSLTVSNDFDSIEAFVWDREHGMRNLNDLVPPGLGLLIDGAYGITIRVGLPELPKG